MSANSPEDRRDYFRINDRIGLEFRKLPPDREDGSDPFDEGHLDGLRAELKRLDLEVRNQTIALAEKDRLLGMLFKSLNGKIDILARIMALEQNPLQPDAWQEVTLSEGGIAFHAPAGTFAVGDLVALRMTLPPELFRPEAVGRVIEISSGEGDDPLYHAEFTQLPESDRQQIARHIMRLQIRHRQQNESGQI
ncbi:PilZ domain-containing protein [Marinobacter sp.]|uniref:PilZ domain-containing protein n=1 Tax=Marinobacter sp. TaxID=50741 RepID=UPI00384CDDEF